MRKNIDRYIQAWQLKKQGKTLYEIGDIMKFSAERARTLIKYINFILRKKNKEYKQIIAKLRKPS